RLAFAKKSDYDSVVLSPTFWFWPRPLDNGWLLAAIPILAGVTVLRWRKTWTAKLTTCALKAVKRLTYSALQGSRRHYRLLLVAGLAAVCLAAIIAYYMLPAWKPEYVISHSTSPDRILRASHAAFNGHFDATPALQKLLGDGFADFMLQKLSSTDEATIEEAACIFAYSRHPLAEKALIDTFLRGQSEDLQCRLLLYLGWTSTDASLDFLTGILEHRIKGVRSAALWSLAASSRITGRYEIISQYLQDPDEKVRQEAMEALERREFTPE
ncbi:MAG TPA: HEAT repeat domain-containing protein, partial [Lentisphaeria bacterium]|nr:HEAT repeat domain-containing protein [Lentisphaeria bacterium]